MIAWLAVVVVLATACGQSRHPVAHRAQPKPTAAAAVPATPAPLPRLIPAQLIIPSIGVKATVEQVGVDSHGDMGVPQSWRDVAWYSPGPAPGQQGDAVIDGHLDWYGGIEAVFWNLGKLTPGDQIQVVTQTGQTLDFQVTSMENVPYNSHPPGLFATTGSPELSLITCAGSWDTKAGTYLQRLVVNASYVGESG